ncbi:hypothetical protein A2U01_0066013, partial [Trifolium medium]|nr:hypothetical protein [Trifolium medium]
ISKNIALSQPLAGRHLATERQKFWPLPATTGDNWRQPRQHLAWRPQERCLATRNLAWRQARRTECSVAV